MTRDQIFWLYLQLYNMICQIKDRQATRHRSTLSLPIFITQICRGWTQMDEYNDVYHDRVKIAVEIEHHLLCFTSNI